MASSGFEGGDIHKKTFNAHNRKTCAKHIEQHVASWPSSEKQIRGSTIMGLVESTELRAMAACKGSGARFDPQVPGSGKKVAAEAAEETGRAVRSSWCFSEL